MRVKRGSIQMIFAPFCSRASSGHLKPQGWFSAGFPPMMKTRLAFLISIQPFVMAPRPNLGAKLATVGECHIRAGVSTPMSPSALEKLHAEIALLLARLGADHCDQVRPSMSRGRPAFGCALRRASTLRSIRSIVSSIGAGPTLQFTPITSAPPLSSAGANCSGGVPSRLLPSSSVVICATIGRAQTARTARMAAPISFRSRNVSSTKRSTPPSASACTCSRNHDSASSTPVLPHGSMRMPSGPIGAGDPHAVPCFLPGEAGPGQVDLAQLVPEPERGEFHPVGAERVRLEHVDPART